MNEKFLEFYGKLKKGSLNEKEKEGKRKRLKFYIFCIIHLFFPFYVDLTGILEVLKTGNEEKAKEYFEKAFENNPHKIFENKLKEAENLVKIETEEDVKKKLFKCLNSNKIYNLIPKNFDELRKWKTNLFYSWFCEVMECLRKLIEEK